MARAGHAARRLCRVRSARIGCVRSAAGPAAVRRAGRQGRAAHRDGAERHRHDSIKHSPQLPRIPCSLHATESRTRRRDVSSRTASGLPLSPGLRAPACCRIEPGRGADPVPVPTPPWAPEEAAVRASFRLCSSTAPADDIRIDASLHPNKRPRPTQKTSDRRADTMGSGVVARSGGMGSAAERVLNQLHPGLPEPLVLDVLAQAAIPRARVQDAKEA